MTITHTTIHSHTWGLPAMLAGLFMLTACGGSALTLDKPTLAKSGAGAEQTALLTNGNSDAWRVNTPSSTPHQSVVPEIVPTGDSQEQVQEEIQQQQESTPAPKILPKILAGESATGESGATGESSHDEVRTLPITFADWTGSFAGTLPSRADTKTVTTTPNTITKYNGGLLVTFTGKSLVNKVDDTILTYTSEVLKANGEAHADGDRIAFTTDADGYIIATSKDGLPMFSESEMVYISQLVKRNGDIPVIMDNPLTKPSGVRNQFLQGLTNRLDERPREGDPDGQVAIRGSLSLADLFYDGVKLGNPAADGVAFFRGFNGGTTDSRTQLPTEVYNYAGLLSGTDLGAPLVVEAGKTATWKGHIRTLGYYQFDTAFDLKVNFGTKRLTTDGNVDNPAKTGQYFNINAGYNDDGVISGTIIIDENGDNFNIFNGYGFITGLIGAEGAVAAFLSSGNNNTGSGQAHVKRTLGTKESITDGFQQFGFTGGFVASPDAVESHPNVRFDDWTGSFDPQRTRPFADTNQQRNLFLGGKTSSLSKLYDSPTYGNLNLKTATYDGAELGGDADDGVAFFQTSYRSVTRVNGRYVPDSNRFYHGRVYSSTDLGAPLEATFRGETTGTWNGQFSFIQGTADRFDSDFTLEINFDTTVLDATINNNRTNDIYQIRGNYVRASGVITAQIDYLRASRPGESTTGIVSGLIGQEGAVAVFVSSGTTNKNTITGGTGDDGYAGGFVARPTDPVADAVASYHRTGTFSNAGTHEEVDGVTTEASQLDDTFDITNTKSQDAFALVQRGDNLVMTVNGTEYTFTPVITTPASGGIPAQYGWTPTGAGDLFGFQSADIRNVLDGTDLHVQGTYVNYVTFLYNFDDIEMRDFIFDDSTGYATIGVRTTADVVANQAATATYTGSGVIETILNNRTHETNFDLVSGYALFSLDMTVDFYGNTVSGTGTYSADGIGDDGTLTFGTAQIVGNGFTGSFTMDNDIRTVLGLTSVATGQYGGHFFGPAADDLAGVLQFNGANASGDVIGIGGFRADKQ